MLRSTCIYVYYLQRYMHHMSSELTLKYDWNNSVDAVDLSASILNFARLVQRTSKDYLTDKQVLKVDVNAFEKGSLDAVTILTVRDTVKNVAVVAAPLIPQIISTTVDVIDLWKFLMWWKAKKISPSKEHPGKVNITNQKWDIGVFSQRAFLHIWDTNITYNISQFVSPSKNDPRLTWQSIISDTWSVLTSVDKQEALYFEATEELTIQPITLIGKIYDMNTETLNGKIDVSWLKISISFKKIHEKPDFWHLVKSLKYKAAVTITWDATIDMNSSTYRSIDILSVSLVQDTLFEEAE